MSELIIIAGPQSAGKSTVIEDLNKRFRSLSPFLPERNRPIIFPLQESCQIVIHKYGLLGAIFMKQEQEHEVMECDFTRMRALLNRDGKKNIIYLDECNIFTIAYAIARGTLEVDNMFGLYLDFLKRLNAKVIFLDISPEISWKRRVEKYKERLVYFPKRRHSNIMRRFREQISQVYPLLKDIYKKLPFPKTTINAQAPSETVLQEVCFAIASFSPAF